MSSSRGDLPGACSRGRGRRSSAVRAFRVAPALARRLALAIIASLAALACVLALAVPASALERKLTTPVAAVDQFFGWSVAVDGNTLAIGATRENGSRGAVYVFERSGDEWVQTGRLTVSDADGNEFLGTSVAIDGETIVAGAVLADDGVSGGGAAYTFAREGPAERNETGVLTASDAATGDSFGFTVAIDGDTIVVGAPNDDLLNADRGSAYTFSTTGAPERTETAKLLANDGATSDQLGRSVAIDGDTIVAGAWWDDVSGNADRGSAYTFARTGPAVRTETAKLVASDGSTGDNLGEAVAIEGDTIVAAAPLDAIGSGAVYTFPRTGPNPRPESAKLTASDGGGRLGTSLAISGDTIVAGAPRHFEGMTIDRSSAYTFATTGAAARTETARLNAFDGEPLDEFGFSVGASGETIVVGSDIDDIGANEDQGSASVFYPATPPPPPPPPGTGPGADLEPPVLTLKAKKHQRLGRPVKVRASCSEACSLVVKGTVKPKGHARAAPKRAKKLKLKKASAELAAGVTEKLKLRLSKRAARKLGLAERGKAKLSARAVDAAGNPAQRKLKLKLR